MKTLFIEARRKLREINKSELENLPKTLHILYSVQFKALAHNISSYLKETGHEIKKIEQVLGCSIIKPLASLLLVGSGRFHATSIAFTSKKPVYIYDHKLTKISKEEIQVHERKEKGRLAKFYSANNIGIVISTKPGQKKSSREIKAQLEKKYKNKKFYFFLADNINLQELENFNIDFWINTACPGLEFDSNKIINYNKIL